MNLFFAIAFTIILLLGIINPQKFIKITEFWRVGMTREPSALMLKLTRYLSFAAIVILWIKYFTM